MKKIIELLSIIFWGSVGLCFADRGMIPMNPNVQLFEPNQRAMIAWNGNEEILLLSTDVWASESTMVLEVLPLPSEPDVKKGDLETFRRATSLINRSVMLASKKNGGRGDGGIPTPAGEVTFHKKIGAHDISVTHMLNSIGFVEWVEAYLDSIDIQADVITDEMEELIKDYIGRGFVWFVFDVISISTEVSTNEPIQYKFATKSLFYPLKITKTALGETTVELLILTPRLLQRFPELSVKRVSLPHDPITIDDLDLKMIDEDMYELLKGYGTMKLRIWNIRGELSAFDKDLVAY